MRHERTILRGNRYNSQRDACERKDTRTQLPKYIPRLRAESLACPLVLQHPFPSCVNVVRGKVETYRLLSPMLLAAFRLLRVLVRRRYGICVRTGDGWHTRFLSSVNPYCYKTRHDAACCLVLAQHHHTSTHTQGAGRTPGTGDMLVAICPPPVLFTCCWEQRISACQHHPRLSTLLIIRCTRAKPDGISYIVLDSCWLDALDAA